MDKSLARPSDTAPITTTGSPHAPTSRLQAVLVVALVGLLALFGVREQPGMATVASVACLGALLLLRFTSIGRLEALGLKVENATREAHEATEEAKATVEQVRGLAAAVGKLALDQTGLRNRLGVLSPSALLKIRQQVVEALRVAGCSTAEVGAAARLIDGSIRLDMADRIGRVVQRVERGAYQITAKCSDLRGKNFSPAAAVEFKRLLAENGVTDEAVLKCLAEYERYEATGEVPSFDGDEDYFSDAILG